MKPDQSLVQTKYFTSRTGRLEGKSKRQNTYIEAIQTLPDVEVIFGHYLSSQRACNRCNVPCEFNQEKMTDVNIAVQLLQDAITDSFDTALIISADSDLIAPIAAVRKLFPHKRIVVARPPGRFSAGPSSPEQCFECRQS